MTPERWEQISGLMRRLGARVQLLQLAARSDEPMEVEALLKELARDSMLTPRAIQELIDDPVLTPTPSCRAVLETWRGGSFPSQPPAVGQVWLPFVYLAKELEPIWGCDVTVPSLLNCSVVRDVTIRMTSGRTEPWGANLKRVTDTISSLVCEMTPQAAPDWAVDAIRYDLLQGTSHTAVYSGDRSFELGAAIALLSSAFDLPLPPGTAAVGVIGRPLREATQSSVGDEVASLTGVFGFDPSIAREKYMGLETELPFLSTVYVAPENLNQAIQILPDGVDVIAVDDVRHLPALLGINPATFRGRRRRRVAVRIAEFVAALPTLGLEPLNEFVSSSRRDHEAMKGHWGRIVGEALGLAMGAAGLALRYAPLNLRGGTAVALLVVACGVLGACVLSKRWRGVWIFLFGRNVFRHLDERLAPLSPAESSAFMEQWPRGGFTKLFFVMLGLPVLALLTILASTWAWWEASAWMTSGRTASSLSMNWALLPVTVWYGAQLLLTRVAMPRVGRFALPEDKDMVRAAWEMASHIGLVLAVLRWCLRDEAVLIATTVGAIGLWIAVRGCLGKEPPRSHVDLLRSLEDNAEGDAKECEERWMNSNHVPDHVVSRFLYATRWTRRLAILGFGLLVLVAEVLPVEAIARPNHAPPFAGDAHEGWSLLVTALLVCTCGMAWSAALGSLFLYVTRCTLSPRAVRRFYERTRLAFPHLKNFEIPPLRR